MKHESPNKKQNAYRSKNDVLTHTHKGGRHFERNEEGSVPEYAPPKPTWV